MAQKFIQKALGQSGARGGLHRSLGVPQGKTIPPGQIQAASSKPGLVGEQARFAMTLSHLRPGKKKKHKVRPSSNKGY